MRKRLFFEAQSVGRRATIPRAIAQSQTLWTSDMQNARPHARTPMRRLLFVLPRFVLPQKDRRLVADKSELFSEKNKKLKGE